MWAQMANLPPCESMRIGTRSPPPFPPLPATVPRTPARTASHAQPRTLPRSELLLDPGRVGHVVPQEHVVHPVAPRPLPEAQHAEVAAGAAQRRAAVRKPRHRRERRALARRARLGSASRPKLSVTTRREWHRACSRSGRRRGGCRWLCERGARRSQGPPRRIQGRPAQLGAQVREEGVQVVVGASAID
jgi:hypothetical protein